MFEINTSHIVRKFYAHFSTLMHAKWAHLCTPALLAHMWISFFLETNIDYM